MIVAVIGAVPVFVAVKDPISPEPLDARPMDVVLFVHAYVVVPPLFVVVKFTADVLVLLHKS